MEDDEWIDLPECSDSDAEDLEVQHTTHQREALGREVYKELSSKGLITRPQGCSIGVHVSSKTWRSKTESSPHFGRSWGEGSGRTERQALIRVTILMLQDFTTNHKDKLAEKQLARLQQEWSKDPGRL